MDIRNCRSCGKMIQYKGFGLPICPQCLKILDEKFRDVKDYLKKNPNATITELAEEVEVPVTQINQWIREERLVFSKDSPIGIDCEGCGTMIKSGRYCPTCKAKMLNQLDSLRPKSSVRAVSSDQSTKAKMRFLEK